MVSLVEPLERLERAAVDKRLARGIACLLSTLTFRRFENSRNVEVSPLKILNVLNEAKRLNYWNVWERAAYG
jgi:hypothetical protein